MIEHALYATFLITFGMQIGRILTLQQQARKTVQGMEALYRSDWLAPAVMAARLHPDQEATGDLPPPARVYGWSPPKRQPFWLERQYEFRRWRSPRLRRAT